MPLADDPTEEQGKQALEEMHPALIWAKRAWDNWMNADAGFVTWYQQPPQNLSYQTHKFSILDAFMTAFGFCETHAMNEWLILGQGAFAVVRTLPQYTSDPAIECTDCPLVYTGRIGEIWVFLCPHQHQNRFCAGVPGEHGKIRACGGTILDPVANFGEFPQQEAGRDNPAHNQR